MKYKFKIGDIVCYWWPHLIGKVVEIRKDKKDTYLRLLERPSYAEWILGKDARLATKKEIAEYLLYYLEDYHGQKTSTSIYRKQLSKFNTGRDQD